MISASVSDVFSHMNILEELSNYPYEQRYPEGLGIYQKQKLQYQIWTKFSALLEFLNYF